MHFVKIHPKSLPSGTRQAAPFEEIFDSDMVGTMPSIKVAHSSIPDLRATCTDMSQKRTLCNLLLGENTFIIRDPLWFQINTNRTAAALERLHAAALGYYFEESRTYRDRALELSD